MGTRCIGEMIKKYSDDGIFDLVEKRVKDALKSATCAATTVDVWRLAVRGQWRGAGGDRVGSTLSTATTAALIAVGETYTTRRV